jgi:molecular chaperone DnaK
MVREAEAHAAEDKARKALVEARNHADALIHQTEKSVAEFGDKVSPDEKAAIETALADLKATRDGEDGDAIAAKTQTLMQASMKLGEAMYKAQAAGASSDGGPEGVVDAEFEEVGDEHKSA